MSSKAQIQAELDRLRASMERLQINYDTARWEIQDLMEKRREAQRVMNGRRSEAEKESARREHDRLCATLARLCDKQDQRGEELQKFRDKESELNTMSSQVEIQTQIALLRRQMEELEKGINASAEYKEQVKKQMVIHHTNMTFSDDEAISNEVGKNYVFYCEILEKVLKKEKEREERMRELRNAERALSISLQSAP
ncbi:hypothetical protein FCIRC_2041 [Fusarium circinatum]|uniref:Uncharacterized protein n=1 Tax=Fusarium circinatum TaxID=48490 RepID=A0A8H5UCS8_FUSCI|nr:hypothetical protein FCIRC_2041 [Fusarium circinatum]